MFPDALEPCYYQADFVIFGLDMLQELIHGVVILGLLIVVVLTLLNCGMAATIVELCGRIFIEVCSAR